MPTDIERMDYLEWVGRGGNDHTLDAADAIKEWYWYTSATDNEPKPLRELVDNIMKDYPRPADAQAP